jgi:hypothetical protein
MAILLLIGAVICWLVAGIPGFVTVAVGKVDWGWLGMFFFGLWLLLAGAGPLIQRARAA